jgi:hypothetical protein
VKKSKEPKIDKFDRPPYKGLTLAQAAMRPNSLKMFDLPSRVAHSVIYPDGQRVWDTDAQHLDHRQTGE